MTPGVGPIMTLGHNLNILGTDPLRILYTKYQISGELKNKRANMALNHSRDTLELKINKMKVHYTMFHAQYLSSRIYGF